MIASLILGMVVAASAPAEAKLPAPDSAEAEAPRAAPTAPETAPPPNDAGPPVAAEPGEASDTPPPETTEPEAIESETVEEPVEEPEDAAAEAMSKLPPPPPDDDLQPQQAPSARTERSERPTQFPRLWLGFGIGPGRRSIGFGVGVTYFVIPYLGIGLDLDDTIVFDPSGTYNVFDLTPTLTVLPLPRYRVSPLVKVGFGGEFISHGLGNYGRWLAQGGIAFKIGRRVFVTVLVGPDGRVPDSRWRDRFTCGLANNPCSLGLVIDLGIGFGFG
jgi:hypothetical protein